MSSAKKIFSNLGASFNRLLLGSETENEKEIPCNSKESKSLSYGNQVYKFSENENEQINLPESETNNEQDRNSPSVIRECITSRDPDMITSNLNKDTFFEQRQQDAVNYDNISTPVSHGIFGSKHNLTFVDSPRDYPLLDQSYITNVEDRNGQNDNTLMHTHQRRDVKWRNVKTTSTGDHMTNVIPQECERGSNWENVLFERVLHDNNQNRDSITQNRNTNIGQQYQTNCFQSKTLSREPETLNKFATGTDNFSYGGPKSNNWPFPRDINYQNQLSYGSSEDQNIFGRIPHSSGENHRLSNIKSNSNTAAYKANNTSQIHFGGERQVYNGDLRNSINRDQ
ncbi:unnamed protein product [Mytilus coruscus]|uniref:Uncharacterized protein n=1 Tax=Mytilus coruscus TaxID=42192 RepID=A0A6J8CAX6_MYTCO|nr:unnamed protein product [Mytilus coruscus]